MDTAAAWREQARHWASFRKQRASLTCPGMHPDHATSVARSLDALIDRSREAMEQLEDEWLSQHPDPTNEGHTQTTRAPSSQE